MNSGGGRWVVRCCQFDNEGTASLATQTALVVVSVVSHFIL